MVFNNKKQFQVRNMQANGLEKPIKMNNLKAKKLKELEK